jgi:hypothetical protein
VSVFAAVIHQSLKTGACSFGSSPKMTAIYSYAVPNIIEMGVNTFRSELCRPSLALPSIAVPLNPLNAQLNPICTLLALFGAHHILHVGR